jgi:CubicO group peptidase (beta-lactamase class C family)
MNAPEKMNIRFQHLGTDYHLNLVKGGQSEHFVELNGVNYAILGDKEKLQTASNILRSLSLESITSEEDLIGRLSSHKDISFPQDQKIDKIGIDILDTKILSPTKTIEEAYQKLCNDLEVYAKKNLGEGALLVRVIGVPGSEPILFGKRSVNDPEPIPVRDDMVGRTGSGCKLWTALLTMIVTTKYDQYINMNDGLGKFAPQEALEKFGIIGPDGKDIKKPEWAREISVEGLIGMTAGLEYEDQAPNLTETTEKTLDQVMRGVEIKPGSIHMLFHPRDKIYEYSNNVCLTAYPIEKAYKKVLAEDKIPKDAKVGDTSKAKELGLSKEVQKLSLDELLKCDDAYINGVYVYDLLDLFLSDLDPPLDNFTYEKILQKELFEPMGMEKSGFYKKYESQKEAEEAMDLTFFDDKTEKDQSKPLSPEHPMVHGMSFGRTTLSDATKLAEKLASGEGLVAENGQTLLKEKDLQSVFSSHSHYEPFGLGAIELSCGNKVIDKGGWVNQDQYTFWVDRESHVGLIAMCNSGRRPDAILAEFKENVEQIYHPDTDETIKEKENTPLGIPIEDFFTKPFDRDKMTMCFEGSRGRVALLFDFENAQVGQKGLIHWSGAPLEVKKLDEVNFCITTPGRFKDINVRIVKGDYTKNNYLAIGFDAFYEIKKDEIDLVLPSNSDIIHAQDEFKNMEGVYYSGEGEHDALIFKIERDDKDGILLCAGEKGRKLIPQSIIKVEKNAISFNGHDRQPPDKIFHFVRDGEDKPWRLQVLDYASKKFIEERPKAS